MAGVMERGRAIRGLLPVERAPIALLESVETCELLLLCILFERVIPPSAMLERSVSLSVKPPKPDEKPAQGERGMCKLWLFVEPENVPPALLMSAPLSKVVCIIKTLGSDAVKELGRKPHRSHAVGADVGLTASHGSEPPEVRIPP